MAGLLLLRRAALVFAALTAAGLVVQIPLPIGPAGNPASVVEMLATAAHVPAERLGGDDGATPITLRKLVTAALFACAAAVVWGLLRRDAMTRLLSGVPSLSATAVAVFRIALALALMAALVRSPAEPGLPGGLHRESGALADWDVIHALAAHPSAAVWIHRALRIAVLMFGLGLLSRVASVAVASLATVHTMILLQRQSAHDWGLPVVTLWLLTIVPWGDALSLDAFVRRARGLPPPARHPAQYGLAVWIPGLTLGVAYLAAAFAKLDSSGLAWVTGGAVQYHFIDDARQAPVDWGLRIAVNGTLARVASGAAVLTEGLLILNVFWSDWRARLGFGAAVASLMLGFYLFQGVFWPLWVVWLLAFVPWQVVAAELFADAPAALAPDAVRANALALPRWQVALLGAFVLQQVVFSGLRFEMEPFVNDFAMYAQTFPSRDAFEQHLKRRLKIVRVEAAHADDESIEDRVFELPGAVDVLQVMATERRAPTGALSTRTIDSLRAVAEAYQLRYHASLPVLRLVVEEPSFDWDRGRFLPPQTVEIEYDVPDGAVPAR
jgi:hypothetical protein